MATIAVAPTKAREFRTRFVAWRREQGAHIFAEPQESDGADGSVLFSSVPTECLKVLDEAGFQYTKIRS